MKRVVSLVLLVGACSPITGNERGGQATYGLHHSSATVNAAVVEHCAKYGRVPAQPPNALPFTVVSGGQYQFECVPPR